MLNTDRTQENANHLHHLLKDGGKVNSHPSAKAAGSLSYGQHCERSDNPYLPYQICLPAGISNEHEQASQQQFRDRLTGRTQSLSHLWRQISGALSASKTRMERISSAHTSSEQDLLDHPLVHSRSGLQEINPTHHRHISIAFELALALAATRAISGKSTFKPILLCLLDESENEISLFSPFALKKFGLRSQDLILVRTRNCRDLVWSMEEGLFSGAVSCVIGHAHLVSQSVAQRLNHISLDQQVSALLINHHPEKNAMQANWRWSIGHINNNRIETHTSPLASHHTAAVENKSELDPCSNSIISKTWPFSLIRKLDAPSPSQHARYEGNLSWQEDQNSLQLNFIHQQMDSCQTSSPFLLSAKEPASNAFHNKAILPINDHSKISPTAVDLH